MPKLFAIFLLVALGSNAFAQLGTSFNSMETFVTRSGISRKSLLEDDDIEGSRYLSDSYEKGRVFIEGSWYDDGSMRFDIFNSCFEIELGDKVFVLDLTGLIADTVLLSDEVFIAKNMSSGSKARMEYLTLLNERNGVSLCKKYRVRYSPPVEAGGYSDAKPAAYLRSTPRYYVFSGTEINEISNLKSVAEVLKVDSKSVKNYMKEKKYKFSREEDLIALIDYFSK